MSASVSLTTTYLHDQLQELEELDHHHTPGTELLLINNNVSNNEINDVNDANDGTNNIDSIETDNLILDELVKLNVGGKIFIIKKELLRRIPYTRLSNLCETNCNYNVDNKEYYFDRNPDLFNCILDYYRTDELHFPHNYCGPSIHKELIYWKIEEGEISSCCWNRYREYEQEKKIFGQIEQAFESKIANYLDNDDDQDARDQTFLASSPSSSLPCHNEKCNVSIARSVQSSKWNKLKFRLWLFLEEPLSSKPAKIWTTIFFSFVLLSIGVLCIETHPIARWPNDEVLSKNSTNAKILSANPKLKQLFTTNPHPVLDYFDTFCTWFFTAEFFLRFIVAPDRLKFWMSIMNIIDILCVLPMWIKYILNTFNIDLIAQDDMKLLPVFFLLMTLRVLRICRVLRLARHYTGVKILMLALKASMAELAMLLIFVFIVVMVFSVVIYYAEFFQPDTFGSIFEGYWWAIITLTTVGYGDMYPKSPFGYFVGAICALTGILATGLPVPIIANNFNLYYSHARLKNAVVQRNLKKKEKLSNEITNP